MVCPESGDAMKAEGAKFEISVDGKVRSNRDVREIAFEAAEYLKVTNPNVRVVVRDLRTNVSTEIKSAPVISLAISRR